MLVHDDMLRARFGRTGSGWQQSLSEAAPAPLCTHVDLSGLSEAQQDEACAAMTTALQTNCKLEEGPLIRVTLCELGPHSPARLLVVIHHLVVDNVSWRIVLEDLHMACAQLRAGQALQLPPKTTSFQYWAEQLTAYAQSPVLQQEMPYWLAAPRTRSARLPVDDPEGTNTLASAYTVSASLSHEETHALLRDVPQAYETHMNDV